MLALALLAAAPAESGAPTSPLEFSVETAPADPRPGERLYALARLRNKGKKAVLVPRQAGEWISIAARFFAPGEIVGYGRFQPRAGELPPLQWRELLPGQSLQRMLDVSASIPECRRGCPAGTLDVRAFVDSPYPADFAGVDDTHLLPTALAASATIAIASPPPPPIATLAVSDAEALEARVVALRDSADGLLVRVRLSNRSGVAMRVPRSAALRADCEVRHEPPGLGSTSGRGVEPPWSEDAAVLLEPRGSVDLEVRCPGEQQPKKGTVRVTLAPRGAFEPTRPIQPPFVWIGTVQTNEHRVGAD